MLLLDLFRRFTIEQGIPAWLVGGAVRDLLLGKEIKDADIAVEGDSLAIAGGFSLETGATFVLLDREWGTGRVVRGQEQIDISPLRGGGIRTDLAERDITINAMAIPLPDLGKKPESASVTDPLGGRKDLKARLIRMVSEENLRKDPLRLLRVYRFSAALSFSIDEKTREAVRRCAPLIASPAPERISAELRQILGLPSSHPTIRAMVEDGIFIPIFPELRHEEPHEWDAILSLCKETEEILGNPCLFLGEEGTEITHHLSPFTTVCLKLSLFLPDPVIAAEVCSRLRLSAKETCLIRSLVLHRQSLSCLAGPLTEEKAIALLRATGDEIHALAVIRLASSRLPGSALPPDRASSLCQELLSFYHGEFRRRKALLPLLTGKDLKDELLLNPSPLFKTILSAVEERVLRGEVRTRPEALAAALEILEKQRPL
ncbi:MAG: hypothetical protein WC291_00815 [Thermodesulfovibrionales bacterium]|jgi:tRNA nucleotidyltransferase/poly(A) polymerase